MTTERKERPDIAAVSTAKFIIELDTNQFWCSTPKAYEIWQREPLRRVKRIPEKQIRVIYVI